MTKVRKGSRFEVTVDHALQFTILLYDEGGLAAQYSDNKLKWLEYCGVFKFAKKSKHTKLMQIFVDLIERNRVEFLNCQAIKHLLAKERVQVPHELHCFSCPNFVWRLTYPHY